MRTSKLHILTDDEIISLTEDINAIGADPAVFRFNEGYQTSYDDIEDVVYIRGDVLPDLSSDNPRDRMSSRAVLAHEYYGHRVFRDVDKKDIDTWYDEFRASYFAAKDCPNLSDEDRAYLIRDAIMRAEKAGVSIRHNKFMRRTLYGYDE